MSDDLLQSVSRSFYLSLRFLPAPMRGPVSLGYLIARLTDTLADTPGLSGDERFSHLEDLRLVLQGQREHLALNPASLVDRLAHPGERVLVTRAEPLITSFRALDPATREPLQEVLLTILHGQTWDLKAFASGPVACQDAEDLLRYTYWVAGSVGEFWTKIAFTVLGRRFADPDNSLAMLMSGRKLGQALQLVNILRDLHEDLPVGRCYLPADALRAAGWSGTGNPTAEAIAPVFRHWIGVCRGFLEHADTYIREVRDPRVRFCTRLPRQLAEETLRLLDEAGPERVLRERLKISRATVWRSALWSVFC